MSARPIRTDDITTDDHGESDSDFSSRSYASHSDDPPSKQCHDHADDCDLSDLSPAGDSDDNESDEGRIQVEGSDESDGALAARKTMPKKALHRTSRNNEPSPKPATTKTQGSRDGPALRASVEQKNKKPARKKTVENPSSDLCPTGAEDCKALCKRAKSAPTSCTTNAAAEADVVKEKQSHEERQASGAPSRKNTFKRRTLSDKRLIQEFPWAGDRQPKSMEESRQISIDMAKLRNI